MINTSPLVIIRQSCDKALLWAIHKLELAGFQAIQTFDLQAARHTHLDCACPHHGTTQCDCQMVVLLVYQGNQPPATLMIIHSSDETSSFFLVNTPQRPIGPVMERSIQEVFNPGIDMPT